VGFPGFQPAKDDAPVGFIVACLCYAAGVLMIRRLARTSSEAADRLGCLGVVMAVISLATLVVLVSVRDARPDDVPNWSLVPFFWLLCLSAGVSDRIIRMRGD
jgi:drug/metabolite transporter (DMT)-like permease